MTEPILDQASHFGMILWTLGHVVKDLITIGTELSSHLIRTYYKLKEECHPRKKGNS